MPSIKLPKNFDRLIKQIETDNFYYKKIWFCQNCVKEVSLINSKQRNCLKCKEKYVLFSFKSKNT